MSLLFIAFSSISRYRLLGMMLSLNLAPLEKPLAQIFYCLTGGGTRSPSGLAVMTCIERPEK
jgi:hypothetical protein